jgi:hypothetical protein
VPARATICAKRSGESPVRHQGIARGLGAGAREPPVRRALRTALGTGVPLDRQLRVDMLEPARDLREERAAIRVQLGGRPGEDALLRGVHQRDPNAVMLPLDLHRAQSLRRIGCEFERDTQLVGERAAARRRDVRGPAVRRAGGARLGAKDAIGLHLVALRAS